MLFSWASWEGFGGCSADMCFFQKSFHLQCEHIAVREARGEAASDRLAQWGRKENSRPCGLPWQW